MSDDLGLQHLRAIRAELTAIRPDIRDMKRRLTTLTVAMASMAANEASHYTSLSSRLDDLEESNGRMKRRLEIA